MVDKFVADWFVLSVTLIPLSITAKPNDAFEVTLTLVLFPTCADPDTLMEIIKFVRFVLLELITNAPSDKLPK